MTYFKLFLLKLYSTIFLLVLLSATTMAPLTLNKPFSTLCGIQFLWNQHVDYGWMSDTLGDKFNFYYFVDDMLIDGIFVDIGKDKVVKNILDKLQMWYVKYIDNPPKDMEDSNFFMIYLKPSNLYPKEDIQILCKNFEEFMFTPQTPVATSKWTFGLGFSASNMQEYNTVTQQG